MSSRHSGSSRHRSHQARAVDGNPEDLVEQVKSIVTLLNEVVSSRPHEWETYLPSARSAVTALDHLRFFRDPQRFAEQVWILHGLQDFAFHDADAGAIQDIAEWCQTAWLRVLRNFPENVETLTGTFNPFQYSSSYEVAISLQATTEVSAEQSYPLQYFSVLHLLTYFPMQVWDATGFRDRKRL